MEHLYFSHVTTNEIIPWSAVRLRSSASQEIHHILWNPNIHFHIQNAIVSSPEHVSSPYPKPDSIKSIKILSSHLRPNLHSGTFFSRFPTKMVYALLTSLMKSANYGAYHYAVFSTTIFFDVTEFTTLTELSKLVSCKRIPNYRFENILALNILTKCSLDGWSHTSFTSI